MTNENDENKILKQALDFYGVNLQIVVAMEELAELISELSRYFIRNTRNDGLSSMEKKYRLAGEVADVEIVCQTLRLLIGNDIVKERKYEKMIRLNERIGSEVRTIFKK